MSLEYLRVSMAIYQHLETMREFALTVLTITRGCLEIEVFCQGINFRNNEGVGEI